MSNLGQIALFGRSYGLSKFCKLALENGPCSHVPGIIGQKFLQHLFSRAFLVKISLLLDRSVSPVGRQTPFLAEIGPFRQKMRPTIVFRAFKVKNFGSILFLAFFQTR